MEKSYEVVVVGGGTAGLAGAVTLGRARRSVLVIDAGQPRNEPAAHLHTYLSREGMSPAEFLEAGRAEVTSYGGHIVAGNVSDIEQNGAQGFRVVLEDGSSVLAARVLVATGLVDELPHIPGLAERWGRDLLHCPYCHGWEVRDQAIGVLAEDAGIAVHQALMWRQWSKDITVFLNTVQSLSDEQWEQLSARDVAVAEGVVTGLEVTDDRLTGVQVGNNTVRVDAVVAPPRLTARAGFLATLGLEPSELEMGGQVVGTYIAGDPTGATAVPGVWVAGNVTNLPGNVVGAANAGVLAGAAINADLTAGETRRAVDLNRTKERAVSNHDVDVDFWDARYAEGDQIWSGNPNTVFVREAAKLTPGRALDLACGEGADAIWLAQQGWQVVAADVSQVGLDRAAEHAAAAGVPAGRIDWQQHNLGKTFPEGEFDLISAQFLYSLGDVSREEILLKAVPLVAPGGVLLIEGHMGSGREDHHKEHGREGAYHPLHDIYFPTATEVVRDLNLPEGEWEVLIAEEHPRTHKLPDGEILDRVDNTVLVRRLKR